MTVLGDTYQQRGDHGFDMTTLGNIYQQRGHRGFDMTVPGNTYLFRAPARVSAVDADIQDAINDGVIVISAAGNSYWNNDISSGVDYDNQYNSTYHSRGSTPAAADNVICVGNIGSLEAEYKRNSRYHLYGKRSYWHWKLRISFSTEAAFEQL